MTESKTLLETCGVELAHLENPLALYRKMRNFCPARTCVIATDGVEASATYMDVFRALARLCGVQGSVKRVVAERSSEAEDSVDLSFYFGGKKVQCRFRHSFKYLSKEFWEWSLNFFKNCALDNLIEVSEPDAPFIELISLPSEALLEAEKAGLSLRVLVHVSQQP